jgi:DNA topoisomerase III
MFGEVQGVIRAVASVDVSLAKFVNGLAFSGKPRVFNDKRIAAHHAIIPVANERVDIAAMTSNEKLIYSMICRRFFAQFMGANVFQRTVVAVLCVSEHFEATGTTPIKPGWRAIYGDEMKRANAKPVAGEEDGEADVALPPVLVGQSAQNLSAEVIKTQTKPPKRYTEGTLIAAMESIDKEIDDPRLKKVMQTKEKAGIGTDATRSAIIEGLFKRGYMETEKKQIMPTGKGQGLIALMERVLPQMVDPVLTALWENELSKVEAGQMTLADFEIQLGQWLHHQIEKIKATAPAKAPTGHVPVACTACARPMRLRQGSKGQFYGCSGYPECKSTLNVQESAA